MSKEITALIKHETQKLTPLPKKVNVLRNK